MLFKELFQEGIAGSGTASPSHEAEEMDAQHSQGGGAQAFCPFAWSSLLSSHRYRVTHSSWCRGDTALGMESQGQPGRVSTVWLRSWELLLLNQGMACGCAPGVGQQGQPLPAVPKGVKPWSLAARWDTDT